MTTTNNSASAPDSGSPPPEVRRSLDALYRTHEQRSSAPALQVEEAEPAVISRPLEEAAPPAFSGLTAEEERLLRRYRQSLSEITIYVNDVELTMDVVHVDRTETSICCLVRQVGFRCKIPRTDKVRIELEGQTYEAAFLGSWHPVDWLGVYVAVFPLRA